MLILEVIEIHRLWNKRPLPDIHAFDLVNITTMSVSAVSVLVAVLFIWGEHTFRYFLLDFVIAVVWFIVFGFHIAHFAGEKCQQGIDEVAGLAFGGHCNELRAIWGFSFLSGFIWLATFTIGLWVIWRERKLKSRKKSMPMMTTG